MTILQNTVDFLTKAIRTLAMTVLTVMMLYICFQVLMRTVNSPIVGDYEMVELMMVVIITFGLAHAASANAHISITLLSERLPAKVQTFLAIIGYILTVLVCGLIGVTNMNVGLDYLLSSNRTTQLLAIPLYPFKFVIGIGFLLWALQAFVKLLLVFFSKGQGTKTDQQEQMSL